jgi:arylsulfatase A-like enzyme
MFVDAAVDFVARHAGQPFLLMLSLWVPHGPLNPRPEDFVRSDLDGYSTNDPGPLNTYYSTLEQADTEVGRLIDALPPDTIVLVTSDNGPADDEGRPYVAATHGLGMTPHRGRKGSLYPGGWRVPLVAWWPSHVPARVSDVPVSVVDLRVTLGSLAGFQFGDRTDGEDVSDVLLGVERPRRTQIQQRWLHEQYGHPIHRSPPVAVLDDGWLLLGDLLYDLEADPLTVNDVAREHPDVVEKLISLMQ